MSDLISRQAAISHAKTKRNKRADEDIMSDYIKREDALNAIEVCVNESVMPEEWRSGMLDAYDEVKSYVPSADVVEVVRCKDCIWRDKAGCALRIVDDSDKPSDNDYCSYGERKEQENE